jgi:hypothetical protein
MRETIEATFHAGCGLGAPRVRRQRTAHHSTAAGAPAPEGGVPDTHSLPKVYPAQVDTHLASERVASRYAFVVEAVSRAGRYTFGVRTCIETSHIRGSGRTLRREGPRAEKDLEPRRTSRREGPHAEKDLEPRRASRREKQPPRSPAYRRPGRHQAQARIANRPRRSSGALP